MFQERKSSAVVLPSLDVVSANYPQAKPSRKMYGRKVSVLHCVINLQSILQFNSILQLFSVIIIHMYVYIRTMSCVVLVSVYQLSLAHSPQSRRSYTYPRESAAWGQSDLLSPTRTASRTDSSTVRNIYLQKLSILLISYMFPLQQWMPLNLQASRC